MNAIGSRWNELFPKNREKNICSQIRKKRIFGMCENSGIHLPMEFAYRMNFSIFECQKTSFFSGRKNFFTELTLDFWKNSKSLFSKKFGNIEVMKIQNLLDFPEFTFFSSESHVRLFPISMYKQLTYFDPKLNEWINLPQAYIALFWVKNSVKKFPNLGSNFTVFYSKKNAI